MPATFPSIDPNVLAAMQGGDEKALERVFRDHFPSLAEDATREVEDGAAAQRVIERVFLRAWEERREFATPDVLERFLHDSTHEGAVRERKRRATLHRFEQREGVHLAEHQRASANGDEAWSHIAATLHAPPPDAAALARAQVEHSRHEAAEHIAALVPKRSLKIPIIIGVAFLALGAVGIVWLNRVGAEGVVTSALNSAETRVLNTAYGQIGNVTLDDETVVRLGAGSKLYIPPRFGELIRAVKIEGAATFTPKPGKEPAFQVRAGSATILVTGTVFDVRAYPGDDRVIVRTREGQVSVKTKGEPRIVAAGQAVEISADGVITEAAAPVLQERLAWTENRVRVTGRPLKDALAEFRRWYGLEIFVRDSSLMTRSVTFDSRIESSREAIAAIEASGGLAFGYEGQNMVLRDSPSKATGKAKK